MLAALGHLGHPQTRSYPLSRILPSTSTPNQQSRWLAVPLQTAFQALLLIGFLPYPICLSLYCRHVCWPVSRRYTVGTCVGLYPGEDSLKLVSGVGLCPWQAGRPAHTGRSGNVLRNPEIQVKGEHCSQLIQTSAGCEPDTGKSESPSSSFCGIIFQDPR